MPNASSLFAGLLAIMSTLPVTNSTRVIQTKETLLIYLKGQYHQHFYSYGRPMERRMLLVKLQVLDSLSCLAINSTWLPPIPLFLRHACGDHVIIPVEFLFLLFFFGVTNWHVYFFKFPTSCGTAWYFSLLHVARGLNHRQTILCVWGRILLREVYYSERARNNYGVTFS